MTQHSVETSRGSVEYVRFGNGAKPLVIVAGLSLKKILLFAEAVATSYAPFADEYESYIFSIQENLTPGTTIKDMAEELAEAMKKAGIEKACVFGASMGGMISQCLAMEYPELVSALVLGSTASRIAPESMSILKKWQELAKNRDIESLSRSSLILLYSEAFQALYGEGFIMHKGDVEESEFENFIIAIDAITSFDVYDDLDKIECPVLVVCTKNDLVISANGGIDMAEKLGCELFVYDDFEHAVYDEAPDFRSRIKVFFDKNT